MLRSRPAGITHSCRPLAVIQFFHTALMTATAPAAIPVAAFSLFFIPCHASDNQTYYYGKHSQDNNRTHLSNLLLRFCSNHMAHTHRLVFTGRAKQQPYKRCRNQYGYHRPYAKLAGKKQHPKLIDTQ